VFNEQVTNEFDQRDGERSMESGGDGLHKWVRGEVRKLNVSEVGKVDNRSHINSTHSRYLK